MDNESFVVAVEDIHFKDYSFDDNSNFITSYYNELDGVGVDRIRGAKTLLIKGSNGDFFESFSGLKVDIIGLDDIKFGKNVCDSYKIGDDSFSNAVLFCYSNKVKSFEGVLRNFLWCHKEDCDEICDYLYSIYGIGVFKYRTVFPEEYHGRTRKKLT